MCVPGASISICYLQKCSDVQFGIAVFHTLQDSQNLNMELLDVGCEMRTYDMNYEIWGAKKKCNVIWSRTVVVSCRDLCLDVHLCKKCWFGKLGAKCEHSEIIIIMATVGKC